MEYFVTLIKKIVPLPLIVTNYKNKVT